MRLPSRLLQSFRGIRENLQPLTGVFASWTERTLNKWISTAAEKNIMTVIEWGRVQKPGWGEGGGRGSQWFLNPFISVQMKSNSQFEMNSL